MAPASDPVARPRDVLTLGAASVMVAFTFFILITGGGQISLGGLTLSAHDWRRPASLAAVLLIVGGVRAGRAWTRSTWLDRAAADAALFTLATITLVMNSLWWFYLVKACGGLDSHGYVSAAELLTTGHLSVTQPIAAWLPFPGAIDAATPLGWVPALAGPESVPRYPLGLPLVMALFREIGGAGAVFYVSPVLASATLVLIYFIVRRAGGVLDAALATALVAVHPVFFTYALQPMSDVPATFWIVLAVFLLTRERAWPVAAGVAAGMAMLTRPVLGLAAIVLAVAARRGRPRDDVRFALGFGSLLIVQLLVSAALYGRATGSGYGDAANLFAIEAIPRNVAMYAKWFLRLQTPLVPAVVAAAWLVGDRFVRTAFLLFAAVAAPYLLYVPFFDDWETLRFLLPGLVFLLMAAAHAATRLLDRLVPAAVAALLVIVLAIGAAAGSVVYLRERQVFRLWAAESKYPAVAEWVSSHGDANAVVFASLHSGSVHYYSGRTTVRWDRIPADRLAATVASIGSRGSRMFLVLDGNAEREEFQQRFGSDPSGVRIEFVDRVRDVSLATVQSRN